MRARSREVCAALPLSAAQMCSMRRLEVVSTDLRTAAAGRQMHLRS